MKFDTKEMIFLEEVETDEGMSEFYYDKKTKKVISIGYPTIELKEMYDI